MRVKTRMTKGLTELFGFIGRTMLGLCFVMHYLVPFLVCNHLYEKDRAGGFALIVCLVSCGCQSSVALTHNVLDWSAVYDCGISIMILLTCFLLFVCKKFILRLKIKCNDWLLADMCPQATNHGALF